MQPLKVAAVGMVTGVGLSAPAAAAAMRCSLDGFVDTAFVAKGGEWVVGCPVPMEGESGPLRGRAKLLAMARQAVAECLPSLGSIPTTEVPLVVCLPEKDRPGRLEGLDASFLNELVDMLGNKFHPGSAIAPFGKVALPAAVRQANQWIGDGRPACLVVGTDSLLVGRTLSGYDRRGRLLGPLETNGFLPGEAAGAVLLAPGESEAPGILQIVGMGFGQESATIESDQPCKADGLTEAIRQALADARLRYSDLDYRITDVSGEQYGFRESALALTRVADAVKAEFEFWHPADSIGEVGAAVGPIMIAIAHQATMKGYAPGPGVLLHFSSDDGRRAALVLQRMG